jgi:predicted metalloprotease with PDZ domain
VRLHLIVFTAATLLSSTSPAARGVERRATLTVDATDAARHILHAKLAMPAAPGPLTLRYPKWIPGEHAPTGPIVDVAGLVVRAGGKTLAWRRDEIDLYAVHTVVPAGAGDVEVSFDYLAPAERDAYSSGGSTTAQLVDVEWNLVVMYPDGVGQRDFVVTPRLVLPRGWKHGSALETARVSGDTVEFKPVTLETLVDSPVIAGAFFKSFPLGPGGDAPQHFLDVVADSEMALQIEPSHLDAIKRLVVEANALFGTRHYARYHFLLTLSDHVAHFGLEHHQSSDNRTRERFLVDATARQLAATLLPHEFVHSWNGKFRRPVGLAVDGFDKPMKGELLWVYEGLTQYLGWVLGARSGLTSPELTRDELALTAALMDGRAGRQWRPLADTAIGAQLLHRSSPEWQSWRRAADYYPEGELLWLEVDVALRQRSGGAKSMDDFCRAFHGGPNHGAEVRPYTLDDVVATLDGIVANDWRSFLQKRIEEVQARAPLGGITGGGWKLVYDDKPNERLKAILKEDKLQTFAYTLGFNMKEDGQVMDVIPGSVAAKAGLGPAMKVVAVNGRKLHKESLDDALKMGGALELLVVNADYYKTVKIDYRGGAKYPHLDRDAAKPDLLQAITRPLQTSISPTK